MATQVLNRAVALTPVRAPESFTGVVIIDLSLTRKRLFRRDPENIVDVGRLEHK